MVRGASLVPDGNPLPGVISLILSEDRSRGVVISESGRATLLSLDAGLPKEAEIARSGVLAAALHPTQSDTLATSGAHRLAQTWGLSSCCPVLRDTLSVPDVSLDSIAFVGNRLLAIDEPLRLFVLDPGVRRLAEPISCPIDRASLRAVPNHHAEIQLPDFDALDDAGDRIAFPDQQHALPLPRRRDSIVRVALSAPPGPASAAVWQQRLKWIVYALLFLDFLLYLAQDVASAHYTLLADPSPLEWARAYVTSIDLAAWFMLILFFELETYVLADRMRTGAVRWGVQGARDLLRRDPAHDRHRRRHPPRLHFAKALPDAADLCAYANGDWSFLENRGYTTIDGGSCAALGAGPAWFVVGSERVIVDQARLREGLILAWTDVVENLAWLLIVACNEVIVRVPQRGFGTTALLTFGNRLKGALYTLIVCIALYWGSKDQFLYLWDELLWVGGFALIERTSSSGALAYLKHPVSASGTRLESYLKDERDAHHRQTRPRASRLRPKRVHSATRPRRRWPLE